MSARIIMMAASALALAASGRDLALRNVYSDRMLFQRDQPFWRTLFPSGNICH